MRVSSRKPSNVMAHKKGLCERYDLVFQFSLILLEFWTSLRAPVIYIFTRQSINTHNPPTFFCILTKRPIGQRVFWINSVCFSTGAFGAEICTDLLATVLTTQEPLKNWPWRVMIPLGWEHIFRIYSILPGLRRVVMLKLFSLLPGGNGRDAFYYLQWTSLCLKQHLGCTHRRPFLSC